MALTDKRNATSNCSSGLELMYPLLLKVVMLIYIIVLTIIYISPDIASLFILKNNLVYILLYNLFVEINKELNLENFEIVYLCSVVT